MEGANGGRLYNDIESVAEAGRIHKRWFWRAYELIVLPWSLRTNAGVAAGDKRRRPLALIRQQPRDRHRDLKSLGQVFSGRRYRKGSFQQTGERQTVHLLPATLVTVTLVDLYLANGHCPIRQPIGIFVLNLRFTVLWVALLVSTVTKVFLRRRFIAPLVEYALKFPSISLWMMFKGMA